MSDHEIRDLVLQGIRYYKRQNITLSFIRFWVYAFGIAMITIFPDLTSSGIWLFAWCFIVVVIQEGIIKGYITKQLKAKLKKDGLDPERLKIEI